MSKRVFEGCDECYLGSDDENTPSSRPQTSYSQQQMFSAFGRLSLGRSVSVDVMNYEDREDALVSQRERLDDIPIETIEFDLMDMPGAVDESAEKIKAEEATKLRGYQKEMLDHCMKENTIVVLQTGTGKTRIATDLILKRRHTGICVFVCPTQVLVEQQADVIERDTGMMVLRTHGDSKDHFPMWHRECVVVSTPQKIVNELAMDIRMFDAIGTIILDEVHHTRKDDPYNKIIEFLNEYRALNRKEPPRVVGLTATPAVGRSFGETALNILRMCATINAKVRAPLAFEEELKKYTNDLALEEYSVPMWPEDAVFDKWVKNTMSAIQKTICDPSDSQNSYEFGSVEYADQLQHTRRKRAKASDTEMECACFALKVFNQSLMLLDEISGQEAVDFINRRIDECLDPSCKAFLAHKFSGHPQVSPHKSKKLERLLQFLQELKTNFGGSGKVRAIIFMKTRSSTIVLSSELRKSGWEHTKHMVGHGAKNGLGPRMGNSEQKVVRDQFNSGEITLLVSTSVAEEGIDVQKCNAVIRYDTINTALSLVQSRGRARAKEGRFCIFHHDDPELSKKLELLKYQEMSMLYAIKMLSEIYDSHEGVEPKDIENFGSKKAASILKKYCESLPFQNPTIYPLDPNTLDMYNKRSGNELFGAPPQIGTSPSYPGQRFCVLNSSMFFPLQSYYSNDQITEVFEYLKARDLVILPSDSTLKGKSMYSSGSLLTQSGPVEVDLTATYEVTSQTPFPQIHPDKAKNALQWFCQANKGEFPVYRGYSVVVKLPSVQYTFKCGYQGGDKGQALVVMKWLWETGKIQTIPSAFVSQPGLLGGIRPAGGASSGRNAYSPQNAKNVLFHFKQSGYINFVEDPRQITNYGRNLTWIFTITLVYRSDVEEIKGMESTSKKESEKDAYFKAVDYLVKKYNLPIPEKLASMA